MKKLFRLSMMLFAASIIFISCGSDDSVTPEPPVKVAVTGVVLDREALELAVGASEALTATVAPANATDQNVTWTSSNPAVATAVDGLVTALTTGTATITVSTVDGNRTATSKVTVSGDGNGNGDNGGTGIGEPTATTDPGVIIAGTRWATRNVDMPGKFVENLQDVGMFYQWNRRIGWSSTNPLVNSNGDTTWNDSNPTGSWVRANDPCPPGWRVPTQAEFTNLQNQPNTWTQRNGIDGRIFGTAPNEIFLPAAGRRISSSGARGNIGTVGFYWHSTPVSGYPRHARILRFNNATSSIMSTLRADGLSIRCVAE